MKDTFLKACTGQTVDYTPVWLMRQAGRYLPEYQKIRAKVDFLTLCKTPELAAQVTLQPVERLQVDAAILFSDILIPVEPMGMNLTFSDSKGPILSAPVRDESAASKLRVIDAENDVPFVMEIIKILVNELSVPLIGFSGAPFTLATYMIEGGSSKNFLQTKRIMYQSPGLFATLMEKITVTVISYLKAQINAGVHAIQIFDTWAGILSPQDFERHALPYVKKIISELRTHQSDPRVPIIYFAFNSDAMLSLVKQSGADVLGLDWRIEIKDAIDRIGSESVVQGNLDPCVLFGERSFIRDRAAHIVKGAKGAKGHVFNLGHGILPETPVDSAIALVNAVHEISSR
ncbi:MAG: uroporphyrinogen decarboxylase [Dissulfurispiraceae bacterium]